MKSDFGEVKVTVEGAVAVVDFSRPPYNYFDITLIRDIATALEAIDAEPGLRAAVLASDGKAFCAGAAFSGNEAGSADPDAVYGEALRLFRARTPLVGAIQGPAIGGGLGLALVPDFRVASPDARFAANFVKLGINPGFGLTHTLPRLIGQQAASDLFYTGRRINAEEALKIGLVDRLAPAESLRQSAIAYAAEIAENAPLALTATRGIMRAGLAEAVERQTQIESRQQLTLFATADFREGVKAVGERRPGNWTAA